MTPRLRAGDGAGEFVKLPPRSVNVDTRPEEEASTREFSLRDHPGKVVFTVPCLTAAGSTSVAVVEEWLEPFLPSGTVIIVLVANLFVAVVGTAAGGLLVRGTPGERIGAAFVAGVFGLFVYVVAIIALTGVTILVFAPIFSDARR